jgi:transposase
MESQSNQYQKLSKNELLIVASDLAVEKVNLESKASQLESKASQLESKASRLESKASQLESKASQLESKASQLESKALKLESEVSNLKFQLDQLKRMIFGSKSERFIAANNPEQFQIPFDIDVQQVIQDVELVMEQITYERPKNKAKAHPGRLALPSHLPVNEIILEPSEDVSLMKFIGNEITDELEYVPGKLEINRFIRPKYISQEDENQKQEVKIASLDFRPIDKCIAGPNLLAQITIDKYIDHLPIYRQLQRFSREEVIIPSSTIESWQRLLAQLLHPLYEVHKQYAIRNGYLQADESPIKVQDRDKKGSTHQGYMWVYRAPIPEIVYFEYQKGRGMEFPQAVLKNFTGYLQTDGYAGYDRIGHRLNVVPVACWAHARRKFEKALEYNKEKASLVMLKIQHLYEIERIAKDKALNQEERHALRLKQSLPILNELGKYIYAHSKLELPKSPLGKAFDYCSNRWDALQNYLKDGDLEIDNNNIENAIRPLALGRKNYLFAGSHDAAKNIAMYYSFFGTCKKNNINPQKWLVYVLKNINNTKKLEIYKLLPHLIDKDLL